MKKSIGSGWHFESNRHSLAAKGIKTGTNAAATPPPMAPKTMPTPTPSPLVKDVEANFKEMEESIIKSVKENGDEPVQLTYGMIPTFRDWFSPELDDRYMSAKDDEAEEINWAFEEMENRLGKKDIIIWGDEGDGTVMWAGTLKAFKKMNPDNY